MTWYYWLAIYFVGWLFTSAWLHAPEKDDNYDDIAESGFIALSWPIIIPAVLLGFVVVGLSKLMRTIFK